MILQRTFLAETLPNARFVVDGVADFNNSARFTYEDQEVAISIDSRSLAAGDLFVALPGIRYHGREFARDVVVKGASGIMCDSSSYEIIKAVCGKSLDGLLMIVVDEVEHALGLLAKAWRAEFDCPMVAITGSIGKTTTKELIGSILIADHKPAFVAYKNQNNYLGVSMNLLNMKKAHEIGVFELGTSARGEIKVLADMVRPTIAIVTAVAHAHGEGIGSIQDIAFEKLSIFTYLRDQDIGIVCGDFSLLNDICCSHPVARFGRKIKNQVQARKIKIEQDHHGRAVITFTLKWYDQRARIQLPSSHEGLVMNVLGASTIAYMLGISFESVLQGIASYRGVENRFQECLLRNNQGTLINDCYNASPESMKAALLALDEMTFQGKKIAVLGDMFELGEKELYWHRQIGRFLKNLDTIVDFVLVGERSRLIAKTAPPGISFIFANDWQEATSLVSDYLKRDNPSLVLVKASRGMHLDKMVKKLVA